MANSDTLIRTLYNAGFRGEALKKAWAIAMRESGGRSDAFNGNTGTGDQSYGLFQINMLGNLGPSRRKQYGLRSNADLLDPTVNAKVAFRMSQGGKDFGAWGLGPNAYAGAPVNAKSKYADWLKKYPGDDAKAMTGPSGSNIGAVAREESPQQAEAMDTQDLQLSLRQATGNWLLERAAARRSGQAPSLGGVLELATTRRALQQSFIANQPDPQLSPTQSADTGREVPTQRGQYAGRGLTGSAVNAALSQIGKPYQFGSGPSTASFDCSDLIQWAYGKYGVKLPRTTFDQIKSGRGVRLEEIQPGDLVFPSTHHVVLYIGNGKVVAAPHTGAKVQIQNLADFGNPVAIRRVV